jgi:hypothetical protein
MGVTFKATPETRDRGGDENMWNPVEIPKPASAAEESALQVVIEAIEMCDAPGGSNLPEDSPMCAALKDLGYALAAHRRGTTPNMARFQQLVADVLRQVEDLISEAGSSLVDGPKPNLFELYHEALDGGGEDHPGAEGTRELRERFRAAVRDAEHVMDMADKALAPTQERESC